MDLKTIRIIIKVLSVSLLLSTSSHIFAQEKLAINKNGIKVWTYQVPNNPVMQYRAETLVNSNIENVIGLVLDTERGKKWIPYISDLKVIERNNQTGRFVIYMRMNFPFPLQDRDLVVEGKLSKEKDGKRVFRNKSIVDNRIPEQENVIRIKKYEGDWIFQTVNPQQVKVTTSGYADPAGAIPLTFINSFVQQQPYQMLQKMKQQLKTSDYHLSDLPEILR